LQHLKKGDSTQFHTTKEGLAGNLRHIGHLKKARLRWDSREF